MKTQREVGRQQPQKRAFTSTWQCWLPVLVLSAPKTVRTKLVLFISHSVCDILVQQPEQTKTGIKWGLVFYLYILIYICVYMHVNVHIHIVIHSLNILKLSVPILRICCVTATLKLSCFKCIVIIVLHNWWYWSPVYYLKKNKHKNT